MAAFQMALEMGAKEIELDVQLSTDGIVVVCHDAMLSRYGHDGIMVEGTSSEKLLSLDMGSWFSPRLFKGEKMMTLAGLFEKFNDKFTYHIEIKGKAPGLLTETLRIVQSRNLMPSCVFTSFNREWLSELMRLAPSARGGWLVPEITDEVLSASKKLGLFQICPKADKLLPEHSEKVHNVCPEMRVWGISAVQQKAVSDIDHALSCNCDGMTVNWPDWLVHN